MVIKKHKAFVRFGLVHVVATNICVWILTIILETSEEWKEEMEEGGEEGGAGAEAEMMRMINTTTTTTTQQGVVEATTISIGEYPAGGGRSHYH